MISISLTARDEQILFACARFRVVTSGALHELLFASTRRDTMLSRLARLRRADFLAVTSRSRTEEHIWRLGPVGRAWACTRGLEPGRAPRPEALAHHLGIVAGWANLAATCHKRAGFRLAAALPDWELRAQTAIRGALIIPDLLASIETPVGLHTLALEIDRGTEPLHTLRRKINQYPVAFAIPEGFPCAALTLVFILRDVGPGRARSIEKLLAEHWEHRSFVLCNAIEGLDPILTALVETPQPTSPGGWGGDRASTPLVPMSVPDLIEGP